MRYYIIHQTKDSGKQQEADNRDPASKRVCNALSDSGESKMLARAAGSVCPWISTSVQTDGPRGPNPADTEERCRPYEPLHDQPRGAHGVITGG